jgi:hypothetical protein
MTPPVGGALEREIACVEAMDLQQLRDFWQARFGAPPALRSVELLQLLIGWRLQAGSASGLDRQKRRQLQRTGGFAVEGLALGAGTILRRQWQGRAVVMIVTADGFEWEGRRFRSLSAAASAIAGSRWNGPRFFGLRNSKP